MSATTTVLENITPSLNVPLEFADLFNFLEQRLLTFGASVASQWDGVKNPKLVSGVELVPMDSSDSLLQPNYFQQFVAPYLDALQQVGAKVVKVQIGFPLLFQPYYQQVFGSLDNFNQRLSVYRQMMSELRSRGMKVVVQSVITPASGGSQNDKSLVSYYNSLSFQDYIQGRAANAVAVAQLLAPDFLNYESEPDTEGLKALRPELNPSSNAFTISNLLLVTSIRDALEAANIPGLHSTIRTAIGLGTWTSAFSTLVSAYTKMSNVDIIDIHVHPINDAGSDDNLQRIITAMDAAIAAGKSVGMDEEWMDKSRVSEQGQIDPTVIDARSLFSFWSPLDKAFMQTLTMIAHWKRAEYLSMSIPNTFFAALDYQNTPGCPAPPSSAATPEQWQAAMNALLLPAILKPRLALTDTGVAYQTTLLS
ncbi:MAG: hypothetical protein ABI693_08475 [Bryobacteraceae bacterium]